MSGPLGLKKINDRIIELSLKLSGDLDDCEACKIVHEMKGLAFAQKAIMNG